MAIYDVPAGELIKEVAKGLKQKMKAPEWTRFVKTGSHVERAPQNPDWFFVRNASILYRIYKEGPLGTGELRSYYGGRKNRGKAPERKRKAGGKVIRMCLQMLEKEGLVKKGKTGRVVTGAGEKYLNAKSKEVRAHLKEDKGARQEVKARVEDAGAKEAREALRQQHQHQKDREKKAEGKEEKPHKKEEKNE